MNQSLTVSDAQVMYRALGFDVLDHVNSGGFKQVFLANYKGQVVALKVLFLNQGGHRSHLEFRARREAQIMASIDSPYIAKILDFNLGGLQHEAYIAEEFIQGNTLRRKMSSQVIPLPEILQLIDDTFQALLVCASNRIVHRDVKPENIMLRDTGQAVLTDFGLARPLDDSTVTISGIMIGTLKYAPPELIQFNSDLLDETSDLFSFGIVCYELLTGIHPFVPPQVALRDDVAHLMLNGSAQPPHHLIHSIPEDLSRLVMTLLERKRGDRYASVEFAYRRFKRFVSSR